MITPWDVMHKQAFAGEKELSLVEEQLTTKILVRPTWSEPWWMLLNQINIVRGQRLFLRNLMAELEDAIREKVPFPDGTQWQMLQNAGAK